MKNDVYNHPNDELFKMNGESFQLGELLIAGAIICLHHYAHLLNVSLSPLFAGPIGTTKIFHHLMEHGIERTFDVELLEGQSTLEEAIVKHHYLKKFEFNIEEVRSIAQQSAPAFDRPIYVYIEIVNGQARIREDAMEEIRKNMSFNKESTPF